MLRDLTTLRAMICATLILLSVPACRRRTNLFVVPKGFRGAIKIEVRVPNAKASNQPKICDDTFIYRIPPSGVLRLRGEGPFASFQHLDAVYFDGSELPTDGDLWAQEKEGRKPANYKSIVALWSLFTDQDANQWYYVGPHPEYLRAASTGSDDLVPGQQVVASED